MSAIQHSTSLLLNAPALMGSAAAFRPRIVSSSGTSFDEQLAQNVPGVNPQLASVCAQMHDALDLVRGLGESLRNP